MILLGIGGSDTLHEQVSEHVKSMNTYECKHCCVYILQHTQLLGAENKELRRLQEHKSSEYTHACCTEDDCNVCSGTYASFAFRLCVSGLVRRSRQFDSIVLIGCRIGGFSAAKTTSDLRNLATHFTCENIKWPRPNFLRAPCGLVKE